jgi:cytidine deaminase
MVRQLKRPDEVALLRKVYGRQFVLTSAYAPEALRKEKLCERLRRELSTAVPLSDITHRAEQLIERDASEEGEALGQQLRDTFHLADVFIDGINKQEMDSKITRFVDALFGRNDISPSKDEYGMYAAKSASLRSADLSRQVGAALFTADGELVTQGCNKVPKAFGGTYWDLEKPDHRDVTKGQDPNEFHKREILRELVERLRSRGFLSTSLTSIGSDTEIVSAPIAKQDGDQPPGALRNARINDLTEYGRVVHAEMLAICDAARVGRSVKGSTLYCTTFPCHNCTKHILASGIRRVVYMEPYPESRAKDLHPDE